MQVRWQWWPRPIGGKQGDPYSQTKDVKDMESAKQLVTTLVSNIGDRLIFVDINDGGREMPDTKAKIGDTIRIIGGICDGFKYVVIEYPKDGVGRGSPDDIWVRRLDDEGNICDRDPGYFYADVRYVIMQSSNPCRSETASSDVDERIRKQRDDNLRGVFG